MTPFPFETARVLLIPAQQVHLQAALVSRLELEKYIGYSVHPDWTEFGEQPWTYALEQLRTNELQAGWWTWFPVLKSEDQVIGTCGYKGLPDTDGYVEIGYEIAPPFRNQGLGRECAQGLVDRLHDIHVITGVKAHTLATENASAAILRKLGFVFNGEVLDPDDGLIWSWRLELDR